MFLLWFLLQAEKPETEIKINEIEQKYILFLATSDGMKYQIPEQVEQKYILFLVTSDGMKYQIPEQVEQKYLPPDQQRMSEHERYFQV